MESREKYCAVRLRLLEGEVFVGIGDARLAPLLNEAHAADRAVGITASLPDLVSLKGDAFRIREVKFKLERRLVTKAIDQLASGVAWVARRFEDPPIDRVELVVALQGRRLKPAEQPFLGRPLGSDRYELLVDAFPQAVSCGERKFPVSVLLL